MGGGWSYQLMGHAAHAPVHNRNIHLPVSTSLTEILEAPLGGYSFKTSGLVDQGPRMLCMSLTLHLFTQCDFTDFELTDVLRIDFYTERITCPDGNY